MIVLRSGAVNSKQSMNKIEKVYLKCAEELSELLTRILQHLNKEKDYRNHINEEICDVENQIKILKDNLEKDK